MIRGLQMGIEQPMYMDGLISQAYRIVEKKFNVASGQVAKQKQFTHMYEFGTAGVYSDGKRRASAQSSRLWVNQLIGGGGRKHVTFVFRPAKFPRESITSEEIGAPNADVSRLQVNNGKKYPWKHKASDVELNRSFLIRPRADNAKGILFVPVSHGLDKPSTLERSRGWGMRKQHHHAPGDAPGGAGKFTTWFVGWWQSAGAEMMSAEMIANFNRDAKNFNKYLKVSPSAPKLPSTNNIPSAALSATQKTRKQWELQTWGSAGVGSDDGGKML